MEGKTTENKLCKLLSAVMVHEEKHWFIPTKTNSRCTGVAERGISQISTGVGGGLPVTLKCKVNSQPCSRDRLRSSATSWRTSLLLHSECVYNGSAWQPEQFNTETHLVEGQLYEPVCSAVSSITRGAEGESWGVKTGLKVLGYRLLTNRSDTGSEV